jgi:hypothetical protein
MNQCRSVRKPFALMSAGCKQGRTVADTTDASRYPPRASTRPSRHCFASADASRHISGGKKRNGTASGRASNPGASVRAPATPARTSVHMPTAASHKAHIAPFSMHARVLICARSRLLCLSLAPLRLHMSARRPSSYMQVAVVGGSRYNIQTLNLLLQHPDKPFATYSKTVETFRTYS